MQATSHIDFQSLYEREKQEKLELKAELEKLQLIVAKLARMQFGSKSEKFIPQDDHQLSLGITTESIGEHCKISEAKQISYVAPAEKKKRDLPELYSYLQSLPKVYETKEPETVLPKDAEKIGEDVHYSLEMTPAKLFVRVTTLPKYKVGVDRDGKTIIAQAQPPERPIKKIIAGASVIATIITDKISDQLPVFRQKDRFTRAGAKLPYNTLLDWCAKGIDHLDLVFEALKKEVLCSGYIHVDETGLKVLCGRENKNKKKIHDGWLWCYHSSIKKLVFLDYQPGRGSEWTMGILKHFEGIIQTDGLEAYTKAAKTLNKLILICCLVHARRKFDEARGQHKELAEEALTMFHQVYEIERKCKEQGLSYDEITKVRQKETVPILDALYQWMIKVQTEQALRPSYAISEAIAYSLRRWEKLTYFTKNGMLNPDNNPVERSIRPVAVGRKNWLFAGSHLGAQRLAKIYSLIGTCKMNGVDPWEWLNDVITRINNYPINKIHELLPHNWKALKENQSC
jgi:transposase